MLSSKDRQLLNQKLSQVQQTIVANAQYQATVTQHEANKNRINDILIAMIQEEDPERIELLAQLLKKQTEQAQGFVDDWNQQVARDERSLKLKTLGLLTFLSLILLPIFPIVPIGMVLYLIIWLLYAYIIKANHY
ncbi:TPA: hypothetical protein TY768_000176 [Streptococcus suis]|nr:hypothetical protein [Streptococcus suis]